MTPAQIFRVYGVRWQESGEPDLSRYRADAGGGAATAWRQALWLQGVSDPAAQDRIIRAAVARFQAAKAAAKKARRGRRPRHPGGPPGDPNGRGAAAGRG